MIEIGIGLLVDGRSLSYEVNGSIDITGRSSGIFFIYRIDTRMNVRGSNTILSLLNSFALSIRDIFSNGRIIFLNFSELIGIIIGVIPGICALCFL